MARIRGGSARLVLAGFVLVLSVLAAAAEPTFPALTGRIVDAANLIKSEDKAAIETSLKDLEGKASDQLAVVTLPSLQGYAVEDFGVRLARHWQIGQKDKDNGVLLIVAPNERKVRIEVGRGVEGQLTDLMSSLIINNAILPAFRRGDFSGGIRDGVRDIKDVLLGDAEGVKQRAKGVGQGAGPDYFAIFLLLLFLAIFIYVVWVQAKHAQQMPQSMRRGRWRARASDGGVIVVPSSGGWDSDWSGGSGGGGWSGGGGNFGGGGSSGSW